MSGYIPHDDPRRAANLAAWHEGSHPATKNDNGHPRVYYHGSNQKLDVIRPGMRDPGAWFTTNKQNAANYARGHDSYLHEVYLKSKNPMVVPFDYDENGGLHAYHDGKKLPFSDNVSIVKHAQKLGYDGVHFPYGNFSEDDNTFVVFDPHQIKSVDNDGNFRTDKEEINKRDGGEVDDDGITAYHGSPHDFDKFDISKIGTGEGAQAFGHGLYFAESEPIAKHYRDTLSNANMKYVGNTEDVVDKLILAGVDPDHAYEMAYSAYEGGFNPNKQNLADYFKEDKHLKNYLKNKAVVDAIHDYTRTPTPTMYEVRINAHPDHFLDWDRPIHEQPYVMDRLIKSGKLSENEAHKTGGNFYEDLANPKIDDKWRNAIANSKSQKELSESLHSIGIKGIKYLDASSRKEGEGSRNYVVFDHDLVTTKRKYAYGGSVAA